MPLSQVDIGYLVHGAVAGEAHAALVWPQEMDVAGLADPGMPISRKIVGDVLSTTHEIDEVGMANPGMPWSNRFFGCCC